MFAFLRDLRQRWSNWSGDHEMENAIRRHLSDNGYFGGTAKFRAVRLAAVQRPGWLQVFRFDVTARVADGRHDSAVETDDSPETPATYHDLFGLVREDHRHNRTEVRVFRSSDQRAELFGRWSDGLLQLRGGRAMQ
ncbi:MAG TPA: hypothetical protein DDZ51_20425 [Planctomycetaceae bacterium]|nr:hypothetical protein [Planctomycetaceae bacterium]